MQSNDPEQDASTNNIFLDLDVAGGEFGDAVSFCAYYDDLVLGGMLG